MPGQHVPNMINVWTNYGEPRLYGIRETDLIMKTFLMTSLPLEK